MTTLIEQTEKCALCGQANQFMAIGSTNQFGSADLDTRPPEMLRSTVAYWVRRCSACGYCAKQISGGSKQVEPTLRSAEYRSQLEQQRFPEAANSFLCSAMLHEAAGNLNEAGWEALHAAWICDDQKPSQSAACRQRAIDLFQRARQASVPFIDQQGAEEILLADLLRRTGQFDKAKEECAAGRLKQPIEILAQILAFEEHLAALGDTNCHTIKEAANHARQQ